MATIPALRKLLQTLRAIWWQRALGRALVYGLLLAVAWASIVVPMLGFFDWDGGFARLVMLSLPLIWLVIQSRQHWLVGSSEALVARALEEQCPSLRSDVRAALELSDRETDDELLLQLRARRAQRVYETLNQSGEDLVAALPVPPQPWRLRWFAVPIVLSGAVALFASGVWQSGWQHLWRSQASTILDVLLDRPIERRFFSAPDIDLTPPSYLRLAASYIPAAPALVEAPRGSRLKLEWHVLEPLRSATLVMGEHEDAERVSLIKSGPYSWSAEIELREPVELRLEVVTEAGDRGLDTGRRTLIPIEDEAPVVILKEPVGSLSVTPEQQLGLDIVVTDDHDIAEISVRWSFAHEDDPIWQSRFIASDLRTPTWEGSWPLDLTSLRLQPRDELVIVVDAVDHDDIVGPNVGSSEPLLLRVEAIDDLNLEILDKKLELSELILARLADHLGLGFISHTLDEEEHEIVSTPARVTPEEAAALIAPAVELQGEWALLTELAADLVDLLEQDQLSSERETALWAGTAGQLIELTEAYLQALTDAAAVAESGTLPDSRFRALAQAHDRQMRALERAALLLYDLIAEQRADIIERAVEELQDARDRLRELLQEYQATQDPELRAAIEAEIGRLQRRMQELLAMLNEQAEKMPWEHVNMDALDPSELQEQAAEMGDAFEQMRQALEQGNIDAALSMLDQLSDSLDQFSESTSGLGDQMDLDSVSRFDEAAAELMEELTNLAELERAISEDTAQLEEELRQENEERMADAVDQLTDELRRQMQEMSQALEKAAPDEMSEYLQRAFDEVQRGYERLERDLSDGDISSAKDNANLQTSMLTDLTFRARQTGSPQQGEELRQQSSAAARQMIEAYQQLEQLMEQATSGHSPRADSEGERLRQEQQQALERVQQLEQQLGEMEAEMPGIGESVGSDLEQVRQSMGQAEQRLRQRGFQEAFQAEEEAIQHLERARESLQQSLQRERRRQREQGRQISRESVDIPDDNESSRASFRQRVQEAMREQSVEGYREGIRSYYESLVRE